MLMLFLEKCVSMFITFYQEFLGSVSGNMVNMIRKLCGVEVQANQAFKNLCNLVEASGSKVENIVKTTVFIKEMNDFGKINEIYKQYFKEKVY